jgi:hypothetical protein
MEPVDMRAHRADPFNCLRANGAAIRIGGGAASISGFCYHQFMTIGTADLGGARP